MVSDFNLKGKSVLLIGDLLLDNYVYGTVDRVSPEAPVPILNVSHQTMQIGGAGTVLRCLSHIGCQTTFLSVVGDDEAGNNAILSVAELPFVSSFIRTERGRATPVKTRCIAGHYQVARYDRETRDFISDKTLDFFVDFISRHAREFDAVVISDYDKGVIHPTLVSSLSECCRTYSNLKVIVDSKAFNKKKFRGATVFTPNRKEIMEVSSDGDIADKCWHLINDYQIKNVLVTLGADGMILYNEAGSAKIPSRAKEVYDVTGAGDIVVAFLAAGIACGFDILQASHLANSAAGIAVGKMGSAVVGLHELP